MRQEDQEGEQDCSLLMSVAFFIFHVRYRFSKLGNNSTVSSPRVPFYIT